MKLICTLVLVLMLPISVLAECKVFEYPDRNEVVCEETNETSNKSTENTILLNGKNFSFHSPEKSDVKISIFADLRPNVIAKPGDTLFSYYIDQGAYTSVYTFKYESRTGENTFDITELRSFTDKNPKIIKMFFDNKNPYTFPLFPLYSGCPNKPENWVYLKMNSFQGARLDYQIIMPKCLSEQLTPYS